MLRTNCCRSWALSNKYWLLIFCNKSLLSELFDLFVFCMKSIVISQSFSNFKKKMPWGKIKKARTSGTGAKSDFKQIYEAIKWYDSIVVDDERSKSKEFQINCSFQQLFVMWERENLGLSFYHIVKGPETGCWFGWWKIEALDKFI